MFLLDGGGVDHVDISTVVARFLQGGCGRLRNGSERVVGNRCVGVKLKEFGCKERGRRIGGIHVLTEGGSVR